MYQIYLELSPYWTTEQKVNGTFPEGQGEPINVILSANSDSDVLKDTETNGGLRNYFLCVALVLELIRMDIDNLLLSAHLGSHPNVWVSILVPTNKQT